MPGFTHLQVAQPVTFGHHLLAYDAMLARDGERLADCRRRVNRLPLGAAALAGTRFPIDRDARRARAGLRRRCARNSLDAVSDRDFAIEFAAARRARRWCTCRASPRSSCCGRARASASCSSPTASAPAARSCRRRRIPTCPSSCAARAARVIGHLVALLVLMKGQPLAYNKDNQEDKEPLFDTVDTLADSLAIMADLVAQRHRVDAGAHARRGARGLRDRDRPRRLPGAQGRCRSATRTRRSRARCAHAEAQGRATSPTCRSPSCARFSPLVGDDVYARAHARRLGREPRPSGRHRAGAGARGDRRCARAALARRMTLDRRGRPSTRSATWPAR